MGPRDIMSAKDSRTKKNNDYYDNLESYLEKTDRPLLEHIQNFATVTPRQYLTYFLVRYELFKKILNVHGSIVECGVFAGGGLMAFAQCSAIFEPVNHQRRIIGFDTFEGFAGIESEDEGADSDQKKSGGMASHAYENLSQAIALFDQNRFLNHIPKVELVKGDACETIPKYLEDNPHLIISLLYLDFDVYKPTKTALEHLAKRVPKGGIIAFDEANDAMWPGETVAMIESLGIGNLRLERFPFDSCGSFAVME